MNPVVDGYTKTLNYWKIVRKMQKYNLLKRSLVYGRACKLYN